MNVWIVLNDSAFIVGVFDNYSDAVAARLKADFDGVVGAFVQQAKLNDVYTGTELELGN